MRKPLGILILFCLWIGWTTPLAAQQIPAYRAFLPIVIGGDNSESVVGQEDDLALADGRPGILDVQITATQVETNVTLPLARGSAQNRALPTAFQALKLTTPLALVSGQGAQAKLQHQPTADSLPQQVVVRLRQAPLAAEVGAARSTEARQTQMLRLRTQQATVVQQALALDAQTKVLGSVQKTLNAVMLEIDAAALPSLAANPAVMSIHPVVNYTVDLSETVSYIGARVAQQNGFNGTGVRVAVLDSGIDYLHADLGGLGNVTDFTANNAAIIEPGTFPTTKVVGGYDFVGGAWSGVGSSGPLAPDPDPLDAGPNRGHGTHVADIIGGKSGVAPGVALYAVKVCSSISSACSGVALLQGIDYAVDPNGDLDFSDAVDIINLSLGAAYGSAYDDDLAQAVENASKVGVLTVAAAGNSSDKPYVVSTPGAAPSALSVAQTNVPSAYQPLLEVTTPLTMAGFYAATYQPWSAPLTTTVAAPGQYGDGAGGNLNGCKAFPAGSLAGKIVLVNRGSCNFTSKIKNIGDGGGLIGIIGLVSSGDPIVGGDDGLRPIAIPGFVISQADAALIQQALSNATPTNAVMLRFDPAQRIALVGHMAGSSSRGPSIADNRIKPDIGAPGAVVSALAGTGTGFNTFGGTSGAAPIVAGAAALIKQAHPERSAAEIKALLMNTADTNIMNKPTRFGGELAPITRIGGGEVRVWPALTAPAAAWDVASQSGSLSFGFQDIAQNQAPSAQALVAITRTVNVRNYSDQAITYQIRPEFRFANDEQNGAVHLQTPDHIVAPAHGDVQFTVTLTIDGHQLRAWQLNSGASGADGNALTLLEYDGYLRLTEAGNDGNALHLAWHVLPRAAGDITLKATTDALLLRNRGVATTTIESFSLIATSDNLPAGAPGQQNPTPDFRYLGYATYPVAAGICGPAASFVLAFAINTWERQTHTDSPASFEIWLDTNQDGKFDHWVTTRDTSFNNITDGRNLTWVTDLAAGDTTAYFFTDHATNSANTVMLLCAEQIGLSAQDFFTPIHLIATASDFFYGGDSDTLNGITISPLGEQYLALFASDGNTSTTVATHTNDRARVLDFGRLTNNTETGLLLLFRNGAGLGREAGTAIVVKHAR